MRSFLCNKNIYQALNIYCLVKYQVQKNSNIKSRLKNQPTPILDIEPKNQPNLTLDIELEKTLIIKSNMPS